MLRKLCAVLGLKVDLRDSALRASAMSHFAFSTAIKGNLQARHAQARAVATMARAALAQQDEWLAREFCPAVAVGAAPDLPADRVLRQVRVFAWQWDETSQRVKSMSQGLLAKERGPQAKIYVQIMMQSGLLSEYNIAGGRCALASSQHEWFCEG